MILQVKKVYKTFGELAAITDLSFDVERGEIFGIAGPNGSGKSTLFNVISGHYRFSGEVIFDGVHIRGLRPHRICHMGVGRTFQTPTVFSTMTVLENVKVGAYFGGEGAQDKEQNLNKAIKLVGLAGKEHVITENLSLYDKKRTMLAAALATKPKVLLIDEPMAGLGTKEIEESVVLLKKINSELNVTVVIIEHLMKILLQLCHRLLIINYGVKISLGPSREVVESKNVIEAYLGREYA